MTQPPGRTRLALSAYAAGVLVILLMPSAALATSVVRHLSAALTRLGLPEALTVMSRVEFSLNALMFVPVTVLGALAWPRVRWTAWLSACFLGSAGLELCQALFLSGRSAQHADVVANTLGGLLGVLLVHAYTQLMARKSGKSGHTDA